MDMELIIKNAVLGVTEGDTTREAGMDAFFRNLKRLFRKKPITIDELMTEYDKWSEERMAPIENMTKRLQRHR